MERIEAGTGEIPRFFESSPAERQVLAEAVTARSGTEAGQVASLLDRLGQQEGALLDWIGRSEQNARSFAAEPLAALEAAGLGLDAGTVAELRSVAETVVGSVAEEAAEPPPAAEVESPQPAAAAVLQTKGWDLAAAATQATLNEALAALYAEGTIPKQFNETVKVGPIDATISVNVGAPVLDLNPSAAKGQSGFVGITFPIESGTIKIAEEIEIPPGSLEVVTEIAYVHLDAKLEGTTERLSLDFTNKLAIYNVVIEEPKWEKTMTELLEVALREYLQSLPPASFYLGDVQVPKQAAPLAPVGQADFAIQVGAEPAQSVLLLLMLTPSGKSPGSVDFSGVPSLVPAGQKSALYVSNRLLIEQIVVPALAGGLGVEASSFAISGSATTPTSATFSGAKELGGKYEPELRGLTVEVNGGGQIESAYVVHAHPLFNAGETYYVRVDGELFVTPTLDKANQTITFKTTAGPGSGKIECSAVGWIIVAAAIIATFGSVGAFIGIVVAVVVPVLLTQLRFPITLPASLLQQLEASLGSFAWPAQKQYPLSAVELPGDIVFVGEPVV